MIETRLTRSPRVAAAVLRSGGVAAFPTETVYGLGADAFCVRAIKAIFRAKGRPADNPLIVHLSSLDQLALVARRVPRSAARLIAHFFPGPLTVIVPKHPALPREVTAGLDTVGVRMPGHPVAQAFLEACGFPVAAPSANRSGRPSPTTWSAVRDDLGGRIPCILKGGATEVGLESTVVDCTVSPPLVLRQGAVSMEALRAVVPSLRGHRHSAGSRAPARSPGMKYRHYAPSCRVVLVDQSGAVPGGASARFAYIGLTKRGFPGKPALTRICPEVREYAQALFHFFRACEKRGIPVIYCQRVPSEGLGRALMDRLQKAADDHPTGQASPCKVCG